MNFQEWLEETRAYHRKIVMLCLDIPVLQEQFDEDLISRLNIEINGSSRIYPTGMLTTHAVQAYSWRLPGIRGRDNAHNNPVLNWHAVGLYLGKPFVVIGPLGRYGKKSKELLGRYLYEKNLVRQEKPKVAKIKEDNGRPWSWLTVRHEPVKQEYS